MRRTRMRLGTLLVTAVLTATACGGGGSKGDSGGSANGSAAGAETTLSLVAKDIAFDQKSFTVPAGSKVRLTFDNQDSGTPHNVRIDLDGKTFKTPVKPGPIQQTLTFTATKAGRYTYVCDVHPSMKGTLTVT